MGGAIPSWQAWNSICQWGWCLTGGERAVHSPVDLHPQTPRGSVVLHILETHLWLGQRGGGVNELGAGLMCWGVSTRC